MLALAKIEQLVHSTRLKNYLPAKVISPFLFLERLCLIA